MLRQHGSRTPAALLGAIALCTPIDAELLPIVNPGFEGVSRPLSAGEVTSGAGGSGVQVGTLASFFDLPQFLNTVEVPGWRTPLPGGNPPPPVYAGILNPDFACQGEPFLSGYSGDYVACARNVWMQQTLPALYRPGTRYRLSFLAGSGRCEFRSGVYVALLAAPDRKTLAFAGPPGVTTLGITNFVPPIALEGHHVAIAFIGSDGIPLTIFDDFRLEATRLLEDRPPSGDPGPRR